MKPTEILADFIAQTYIEDIPEEAIQRSKWAILDGIAVIFAGIPQEVGKGIISFIKDLGGKPTSTILGDGHRTSAPWAAYANGTLAHAVDYDDVNLHLGGHPTAPVLSALLAAGEKVGASGKEILLSYILGVEVEAKIGLAINKVHYNLGWHPTATLGTLGAAAACGKVIKLNREQTLMALGIAGSQSSALKQNFGTMTKPLHVGQAAKNGVLSALLASRGWTADREILEGHFGFCNLFAGRGLYDLKDMTENLGKPFDVLEPGIQSKKYPCCGSTHASLDAMAKVLQGHPFRPEEVESVECEVHPERIHVLIHPNPQSGLEAKFSLEYCLAAMIQDGKVSIRQFTDERVADRAIRSLLPRIKASQQSTLNPWDARLRIRLRDGRTLENEGGRSPGITTWDELVAKYRDCLCGILPAEQIQQSLQMIQEMEKLKNISEFIKTLIAS
ncbi:MAG: MmgE/PrpD family protein [Deltaproteobacteria bacterium]|nr:MmgE/PrpD family protein [Deltaproteobacteria bacterium]